MTIQDNSASDNGGLSIWESTATVRGGAISRQPRRSMERRGERGQGNRVDYGRHGLGQYCRVRWRWTQHLRPLHGHISATRVTGNSGGEQGGIGIGDGSTVTLTASSVLSNTATTGDGGGVLVRASSAIISDTTIAGNESQGGAAAWLPSASQL